jgi:hypothetical protein
MTEEEVLEQVELALQGVEEPEVLGIIQGKPDRERKGRRFNRRKRGSPSNRGARGRRVRRGR